jgi:hypothetical protein
MMADSERILSAVAVALVTDPKQQVLLTFDKQWGAFTLPMSRRRRRGQGREPAARAAIRAAAGALGVPVRLVEAGQSVTPVLACLESGRELVDKIYSYTVYHVEPHPDFAARLDIRRPHLWLSPHLILSGVYEPISESARLILRSVLADMEIPARTQHTSVLLIQRESPERGRQFLVRWDPDWGYALPAKRWQPADGAGPEDLKAAAASAAERVARQELGLEPETHIALTPARLPLYTTHAISATKEAPAFGAATDYVHSLFNASIRGAAELRSHRPLAWVTQDEIHAHWTAASHPASSAPLARAGRISHTVYEILHELGLIAGIEPPENLQGIIAWCRAIEARLKRLSEPEEP